MLSEHKEIKCDSCDKVIDRNNVGNHYVRHHSMLFELCGDCKEILNKVLLGEKDD